jgi:hypothetical protein
MHDSMSAYAKMSQERSLALFFHGGLVPEQDGISSAQQLIGPYSAPGAPGGNAGNAYPYFFVWESGLAEVLEQNLPKILRDAGFRFLHYLFGAKIQAIRGRRLHNDVLLKEDIEEVQREIESNVALDAEKRSVFSLKAPNVLERILHRLATGHDHGRINTVTEEILRAFFLGELGWSIWRDMKTATRDACHGDPKKFVGAAMIAELVALYDSGDARRKSRVTLIGHSAGAVYICHFMQAMAAALAQKAYAADIQFDVIFMAPAVTVELLAQTLSSCASLVRNLRVFEMSDPIESEDILLPVPVLDKLYTRSLLYFISGVLEGLDGDTPITGMQRFFSGSGPFAPGKVESIDYIANFYSHHPHAAVPSDTSNKNPPPPVGQRCSSHHHGCFPTDGATLQSVCYLLNTAAF